jgi:hypothetical protein
MVSTQELFTAVQSLRPHSARGEPAPHKPIVLLVALGRLAAGHDRLMQFAEVKETIDDALVAAGRPRHAHQPFWRLLSSSPLLWEMPEEDRRKVRQTASGDATTSSMLRTRAGFPAATVRVLRDPNTFSKVVALLSEQIPQASRAQVLALAGIASPAERPVGRRAPNAAVDNRGVIEPEADANHEDDEDEELAAFPEGESKMRFQLHRRREKRLREAKIEEVKAATGALRCEVPGCGFDFESVYGAQGENFAHVHHRTPLATVSSKTMNTTAALAIVCANCHAMIHREGGCLDLKEIRPRRVSG